MHRANPCPNENHVAPFLAPLQANCQGTLPMTVHALPVVHWLLMVLCCLATLYAVVAAVAMPFFETDRTSARRPKGACTHPLEAVSVMKPLCGAEPRLYENLATFCAQTHPRFQLLFGVSSPNDAAIA